MLRARIIVHLIRNGRRAQRTQHQIDTRIEQTGLWGGWCKYKHLSSRLLTRISQSPWSIRCTDAGIRFFSFKVVHKINGSGNDVCKRALTAKSKVQHFSEECARRAEVSTRQSNTCTIVRVQTPMGHTSAFESRSHSIVQWYVFGAPCVAVLIRAFMTISEHLLSVEYAQVKTSKENQ